MKKCWNGLLCGVVVSAVGMLGGCCHCFKPEAPDLRPLPEPISLEEQLQRLNKRAAELPRMIATAQSGGVEIWGQDNGKEVHKSLDGSLRLVQSYENHSANVFVQAKFFDQVVFEAGKNSNGWWYHGYEGKQMGVEGRLDGADAMAEPSVGDGDIFRADKIPDMLGITEIVPAANERVVMRVDDFRGVNDITVELVEGDGTAHVERDIVVDRRSGEVREVGLYLPDGRMLVHAALSHYAPVSYGEGVKGTEGEIPSMPRQVVILYPQVHFQVQLLLEKVTIPAGIKDAVFATPDWVELGIQVERR